MNAIQDLSLQRDRISRKLRVLWRRGCAYENVPDSYQHWSPYENWWSPSNPYADAYAITARLLLLTEAAIANQMVYHPTEATQ